MSKSRRDALGEALRAGRGVITSAEAVGLGVTRATMRWAVDRGELRRLHPGVFTSTELWTSATAEQRHLLRLRAALRMNPQAIACGLSAAVILGLPLPQVGDPQLCSTARTGRRAGASHVRPRGGEVWMCQGIRLTSPARTVIDCACSLDRAWGLAVADAAIFKGLVTVEQLRAEFAQTGGAGSAKARWVVAHAKPKVESPLESLARAAIVLAGLPEPEPQVWIRTRAGRFRVDMLDEANRVVTEADGKLKYTGPQAVWNEKLRQDHLRDTRLEVVRFTMADHHHPGPWLVAYRRTLARAARLTR